MDRRTAIKAISASVASVSLAGCTGGNSEVVNQYESAHTLFQEAKSTESEGGEANEEQKAREKWETASDIYASASEEFQSAKNTAESDEVRQYCERARGLANIKSQEMADLAKGNTQKALMHTRKSEERRFRVADVETVRNAATGFL